MRAIELEATVEQHRIRLPESIPDGTHLRVLLLLEDPPSAFANTNDLKALLAGLTEGLTSEDLQRPRDFGRGDPEWAS
ncbi:hypothetical protein [Thiocystis violacea]|uniref:hypothetical protein n=1 Tax=Thiocystis violacea TaxID=13725 RepID=UPI00190361F7|nr:hypothetical protein [Thiocystis violacea]MBK1725033.1 hypothetical protein [Thiocystis violacea]